MLTDEYFMKKALTVRLPFEDTTDMARIAVMDELNKNITAPQRDLILWHQKWAHCGIGQVQTLLVTPHDTSHIQLIDLKHAKSSSHPKPKWASLCLIKTGCASAPTTKLLTQVNAT
jgi:hypothetical protein